MSEINSRGHEVFDQTPVSFPFKFDRPISLAVRIRQQILQALSDNQSADEYESIEEADDFEMEDDPDMWKSPYEHDFDHVNADLKKISAASKEESAPGGSSDGATQESTEAS